VLGILVLQALLLGADVYKGIDAHDRRLCPEVS
jgi:hypothetical protein